MPNSCWTVSKKRRAASSGPVHPARVVLCDKRRQYQARPSGPRKFCCKQIQCANCFEHMTRPRNQNECDRLFKASWCAPSPFKPCPFCICFVHSSVKFARLHMRLWRASTNPSSLTPPMQYKRTHVAGRLSVCGISVSRSYLSHPFAAKPMSNRKVERVVSLELRIELVSNKPMLRQTLLFVCFLDARVSIVILYT